MPEIAPVILSGDSNTRPWPRRRVSNPKSALPLMGDCKLFQIVLGRCPGNGGQPGRSWSPRTGISIMSSSNWVILPTRRYSSSLPHLTLRRRSLWYRRVDDWSLQPLVDGHPSTQESARYPDPRQEIPCTVAVSVAGEAIAPRGCGQGGKPVSVRFAEVRIGLLARICAAKLRISRVLDEAAE